VHSPQFNSRLYRSACLFHFFLSVQFAKVFVLWMVSIPFDDPYVHQYCASPAQPPTSASNRVLSSMCNRSIIIYYTVLYCMNALTVELHLIVLLTASRRNYSSAMSARGRFSLSAGPPKGNSERGNWNLSVGSTTSPTTHNLYGRTCHSNWHGAMPRRRPLPNHRLVPKVRVEWSMVVVDH
jgi:hypothetical protein